jgi:L-rhamnose isomerase
VVVVEDEVVEVELEVIVHQVLDQVHYKDQRKN